MPSELPWTCQARIGSISQSRLTRLNSPQVLSQGCGLSTTKVCWHPGGLFITSQSAQEQHIRGLLQRRVRQLRSPQHLPALRPRHSAHLHLALQPLAGLLFSERSLRPGQLNRLRAPLRRHSVRAHLVLPLLPVPRSSDLHRLGCLHLEPNLLPLPLASRRPWAWAWAAV